MCIRDSTDRTFGTLLGAEVTRHHPSGLPEDTITILCQGAGGQSFGAFLPKPAIRCNLGLNIIGKSDIKQKERIALFAPRCRRSPQV